MSRLLLTALLLCAPAQAAPPPDTAAHTVTRGGLTLTYRDAGDAAQVGAVFRAFAQARADLRRLGLGVGATHLDAARDAADFAARTGEPASIAASTRGTVIRTQRLAALAARGLLPLTIRHETFHTVQPPGLPRWLAEGLARIFSGEARQDRASRSGAASTGLENLSAAQLDRSLLSRTPGEAGRAYREATRRAAALLERRGWKGTLTVR